MDEEDVPELGDGVFTITNLESIVQGCRSENNDSKLSSWTKINSLLESGELTDEMYEIIIDKMVEHGIISCLIKFLSNYELERNNCNNSKEALALATQVLSCLINMTASRRNEHIEQIIECKPALHKIINLIMCPNEEIVNCVLFTIGNILGDTPECRDILLNEKVLYQPNGNGKEGTVLDRLIQIESQYIDQLRLIIICKDTKETRKNKNIIKNDKNKKFLTAVELLRLISWIYYNCVRTNRTVCEDSYVEMDIDVFKSIVHGIISLLSIAVHNVNPEILENTLYAMIDIADSINKLCLQSNQQVGLYICMYTYTVL